MYLVEKHPIGPIAIVESMEEAIKLFSDDELGIITEMELGKVYKEGIGVCHHVHIGEE